VRLGTGMGANNYYCGRVLGVRLIPLSDGQCGAYNGPQCMDCRGLTRASPPNAQTVSLLTAVECGPRLCTLFCSLSEWDYSAFSLWSSPLLMIWFWHCHMMSLNNVPLSILGYPALLPIVTAISRQSAVMIAHRHELVFIATHNHVSQLFNQAAIVSEIW